MKKQSELEWYQKQVQLTIERVNRKIEDLGNHTLSIYEKLKTMEILFEKIRNVPLEDKLKYEETKKIRCEWKQQADKIEADFKNIAIKKAGMGVAGVGAGAAVAFLGPAAAMGVATTFGVASTGTAIASLSGAAATNAALAWLGGGALAAGGGGMAAGNAFLGLAGPVGLALAAMALLGSGAILFKSSHDKKKIENVFIAIADRDIKSYKLSIVELNERMDKIKHECDLLDIAIRKIEFMGTDYMLLSETEQYELGAYVNLMYSSTQLLVEPILGLQPKYTEEDYKKFLLCMYKSSDVGFYRRHQEVVISLANTLYKINMNDTERKLLLKTLRNNKEFLKSIGYDKNEFTEKIMETVDIALEYKYSKENIG